MSYSKDNDIDYTINPSDSPKNGQLLLWHKVLYALLIFIVVISLLTNIVQATRIGNLTDENAKLHMKIEELQQH